MTIQLIPAHEKDLVNIKTLADKIWKAYYPAIIGMEQVEYMLHKNYSLPNLTKQMNDGQRFYLIENENGNIGFMSITETSANHFFMNKFYLDTELTGKGLGKIAFSQLLKEIPEAADIKLQVNRQNILAINFYFSVGFKIEESADFDIGDGYFMNDFIMKSEKLKVKSEKSRSAD